LSRYGHVKRNFQAPNVILRDLFWVCRPQSGGGCGRDLHLVWIVRLVLSSSGRLFPPVDALARDGITDEY